ncbi:MAG: hypothetical protein ACE5EH_12570 [Gammaproteobacteria bacterium]
MDAESFHLHGEAGAMFGDMVFRVGAPFYELLLATVYRLFGASHLLGEELSILAFSLSCVVLLKLLKLLELFRYRVPILLCFGALPSMVFLGSVTLRESYQVLFFMLVVYFFVKYIKYGGLRPVLECVISIAGLTLFHWGLMIYAALLSVAIFLQAIIHKTHKRLNSSAKGIALVAVLLGILIVVLILSESNELLQMLKAVASGSTDFAAGYRASAEISRATYGIPLDTSSVGSILFTSFVVFFYYLFSPFPWQIQNMVDIYGVIEVLWRILLIYMSLKMWRMAVGTQRKIFGSLLVFYFSMAFLWSLGTTNYGTSIRHHMVHYWIIVVLGVPLLSDTIKNIVFGNIRRHIRRPC